MSEQPMSDCPACGAADGEIHRQHCPILLGAMHRQEEEMYRRQMERRFTREPHHEWHVDNLKSGPTIQINDRADPACLYFVDDNGNDVGVFRYNPDKRNFEFSGDMDESAKIFARMMYANFQSIIEGDHDGLRGAHIAVDPARDDVADAAQYVWPERLRGLVSI